MLREEQKRARFALQKVEGIKDHPKAAKYKTQLLKLPARLHSNGLGQTVGYFLAQKDGSPEWDICTWLEAWLGMEQSGIYRSGRLVDCVCGAPAADLREEEVEPRYRRASAEARALANWLKRFAEAFLSGAAE